jgi:hypothetical protein
MPTTPIIILYYNSERLQPRVSGNGRMQRHLTYSAGFGLARRSPFPSINTKLTIVLAGRNTRARYQLLTETSPGR